MSRDDDPFLEYGLSRNTTFHSKF